MVCSLLSGTVLSNLLANHFFNLSSANLRLDENGTPDPYYEEAVYIYFFCFSVILCLYV